MKPYKRLACLVTLIIACGHPLSANTSTEFRDWIDVRGRTTAARFVRMVNSNTVEIEHKETKLFYRIPVTTLSEADQKYLAEINSTKVVSGAAEVVAHTADLKDPDAALWAVLQSAGSQSTLHSDTKFEIVLELMNQRFLAREITTPEGRPLSIRTEPADLTQRISIPRDMRRMRIDEFLSSIAQLNDISVKVDTAGMIVLMDKAVDNQKSREEAKTEEFDFYKKSYTVK
jgi:hypothetical protein